MTYYVKHLNHIILAINVVRSYELHASEVFSGFTLSTAEATEAPGETQAEDDAEAGNDSSFVLLEMS